MLSIILHITLFVSLTHTHITISDVDTEILLAHNLLKQSLKFWLPDAPIVREGKVKDYVWDNNLAINAYQWAQQCKNNRSSPEDRKDKRHRIINQNVAISGDILDAVMVWAVESANYNVYTGECKEVGKCENYRNLLLPGTVYLGCGFHWCPDLPTTGKNLVVCNYSPEESNSNRSQ
ncbi:unnamed protein product [Trichobilharzia szidati]|nr:unnamed protein product [Trichobilharzia szidati]